MRKEYNENLIFDNGIVEESKNLLPFSLESMIRGAAQRMIAAALEAEVAEFLERLAGEKTSSREEFRGLMFRFVSISTEFSYSKLSLTFVVKIVKVVGRISNQSGELAKSLCNICATTYQNYPKY